MDSPSTNLHLRLQEAQFPNTKQDASVETQELCSNLIWTDTRYLDKYMQCRGDRLSV
jgi:hypothetical protein